MRLGQITLADELRAALEAPEQEPVFTGAEIDHIRSVLHDHCGPATANHVRKALIHPAPSDRAAEQRDRLMVALKLADQHLKILYPGGVGNDFLCTEVNNAIAEIEKENAK